MAHHDDAAAALGAFMQMRGQVAHPGGIEVVGRLVEEHQVGRRLQYGPQRQVMALPARQAIQAFIEAPRQPGGQALRAGPGQAQQFPPGQRQALDRRHLLGLQGQPQIRLNRQITGKNPGPTGKGSQQGALADAIRTGQADDFAGLQDKIDRLRRRDLPTGHQTCGAQQGHQRKPFSKRWMLSSNRPNKSLASGVPPTVYGNSTAGRPVLPAIH